MKCMTVSLSHDMAKVAPFVVYVSLLTSIFTFFLFCSNPSPNPPLLDGDVGDQSCDLSEGKWVPDLRGSVYTNSSCVTIPDSKNCFKHGRTDTGFLHWRWKPHGCELPRFSAKLFFRLLRGKTMGFIGDSVARNHMDSLLCLLSQEEAPMKLSTDPDDRSATWHFADHDFTLMVLWSKYLVASDEITVNASSAGYHLFTDHMDPSWAARLPVLDYAVVSTGHWFNRPLFLHRGPDNATTHCVYCKQPNVASVSEAHAMGVALGGALDRIAKTGRVVALVRTFSPAHFEEGEWNTGGRCARTRPYGAGEVREAGAEWAMREAQMEEVARRGVEAVDVTKAMMMRPDGHPGVNWDNRWMKGFSDCVHWCLPGVVDVWNDIMLAVIRRRFVA